jgi:hypothetical protein
MAYPGSIPAIIPLSLEPGQHLVEFVHGAKHYVSDPLIPIEVPDIFGAVCGVTDLRDEEYYRSGAVTMLL